MTWMELYMLLKSMVEAKHTSLCDTPAQRVSVIANDEEMRLDLVESMTTGKLIFVPKMLEEYELEENDDVG